VAEIVVVGSVNIDMTCYLARWPSVGETVTAVQSTSAVGGKGANQAVAAARLGGQVRFIGAVGSDAFGKVALDALKTNAVATTVEEIGQQTGMAFIDVGPDGRNIIRLHAGANGLLSAQTVEGKADKFRSAKVLLLQNEIGVEASLAAARAGRAAGARVIMDPAPAPVPMWPVEHFKAFDLITPNATEAGVLLGETPETLQQGIISARALEQSLGCGVIITMGELGAAWSVGESSGTSVCPKVEAIDTVAAGDCFNGALAVALAKGSALDAAIAFAMRAAGIATTRRGAIDSLPYLQDVEGKERCST
jgi:ribokinase